MRRWLTALITLAVLGAMMMWYFPWLINRAGPPIRVGILHSQTGAMEISEKSMIDAEVLALEEINANGGFHGRRVEWVNADGRSDWPTFAREAERLIDQEKVSVIFGCWTSASRKSVKAVVEQKSHLLFYPMAYEGLEQSPSIVYTGAAPNQQVIPAVSWCHEVLKARKFFLVGSDYVWPRCVNEIVKDQLKALGAECVGQSYIILGSTEVAASVEAIQKAKPDVIISTVVGDSNGPFFQRLQTAGILPDRIPVISFSIAEDELRKLPLRVDGGGLRSLELLSDDRPAREPRVHSEVQGVTGPTVSPATRLWRHMTVSSCGRKPSTRLRPTMWPRCSKQSGGRASMRRRESCRWMTRPSTLGGRFISAGFGAMASSSWSGARGSRCVRSPFRGRVRNWNGSHFWPICTGPGAAGPTPAPVGAQGGRWHARLIRFFDHEHGRDRRWEAGSGHRIGRDEFLFRSIEGQPAMTLRWNTLLPTRVSISTRLLLWFLVMSLIPCGVLTGVISFLSTWSLERTVRQGLLAVSEAKATQLETFMRERRADLTMVGRSLTLAAAMQRLSEVRRKESLDSPVYLELARPVHPIVANYVESFGYANGYLFDTDGTVLFQLKANLELGSNLLSGPLKGSELAEVFDRVRTLVQTEVSDYELYQGRSEPAAFIAGPVFNGRGGSSGSWLWSWATSKCSMSSTTIADWVKPARRWSRCARARSSHT